MLEGRVAIVTGGTRGIGLAISRTLAAHGSNLIIGGHSDEARAKQVASELADEFGVAVLTAIGDVGDPAVANFAAKVAFDEFRQLDIVVNNAGVLEDALIGMISNESVEKVLSTNVKSVINFTQSCARLLARGGGGSIINVSSIIGRVGNSGQLVYGASKAAVIGATLSAAKELAEKNVRVNTIAPGYIDTDMIAGIDAETDQARRDSIAMKRVGTPEDVANVALFLSSDLSSYVTGQVIGVDGGMLI